MLEEAPRRPHLANHDQRRTARNGSGRTPGDDSAIQRGWPNPDDQLFGHVTSRTRHSRCYDGPFGRLTNTEAPKGTNLSVHPTAHVNYVTAELNDRPRKAWATTPQQSVSPPKAPANRCWDSLHRRRNLRHKTLRCCVDSWNSPSVQRESDRTGLTGRRWCVSGELRVPTARNRDVNGRLSNGESVQTCVGLAGSRVLTCSADRRPTPPRPAGRSSVGGACSSEARELEPT